MVMMLIVFLPLLAAWSPPVTERFGRSACAWLTALAPAIALVLAASYLPAVMSGEVLTYSLQWLPATGLDLEFRIDSYSLMFAMLILGIGLLVILYARF